MNRYYDWGAEIYAIIEHIIALAEANFYINENKPVKFSRILTIKEHVLQL